MNIIHSVQEMQARADQLRRLGKTTAFVPTMGYLHEGHLSLLRIGKQKADDLVLSIFVNPAQFGPNEDLGSYPRSLDSDLEMAEKEGVDAVFVPTDETLYQAGYQTYVELEKLPGHLCGLSRPVFFKGVTTVVTQLFNIVKPHVAVFGEKDFQQLAIIRQMVRDLKFDIDIVGGPIVREADGLAMSSRNAYLKDYMRPAALSLSRVLENSKKMVKSGVVDARLIADEAEGIFSAFPEIKVDYISICDPVTLDPVESVEGKTLMALAVALEKIRLIDNTILQP
ncbi:MAG: pantoate--beta-alanine ligase [Desulforhopalus sp.]